MKQSAQGLRIELQNLLIRSVSLLIHNVLYRGGIHKLFTLYFREVTFLLSRHGLIFRLGKDWMIYIPSR